MCNGMKNEQLQLVTGGFIRSCVRTEWSRLVLVQVELRNYMKLYEQLQMYHICSEGIFTQFSVFSLNMM